MMPGLRIQWEYLTGYAVATDPASRERAEWPPHPARVFMALAATYFEIAPTPEHRDPDQRAALEWLEQLDPPALELPPVTADQQRSMVTVYVPVNDKAGPAAATLQSVPSLARSKQPRTFPRHWVGIAQAKAGPATCAMHWPDAPGVEDHIAALDALCGQVTRIGHSSSLVWMRADATEPRPDDTAQPQAPEHWLHDDALGSRRLRRWSPGMLKMLEERFGEARREPLDGRLEHLYKGNKVPSETKKKKLATEYDQTCQRPTVGLWAGYRRTHEPDPTSQQGRPGEIFDHDLLVLQQTEGPTLAAVSTLQLTYALRGAVQKACPDPVPQWVCGHDKDCKPLSNGEPHLALMPLPHVGHPHADGHLLGLAIAFPRSIPMEERGRALGPLLVNESGEPKPVHLKLGRLGTADFILGDPDDPRHALHPETWTAAGRGSHVWASVTPVVLDRFPKADRHKARGDWEQEVCGILRAACLNAGLPEPTRDGIQFNTTAWHHGAPRAIAKRRRLRRGDPQGNKNAPAEASFGDGFPLCQRKPNDPPRPQVHVCIRFDEPVVGPVLLGAGRHHGYGTCKPLGPKRLFS